jgi:hypothetical protein
MSFIDDIQGQNTQLYPIVTIEPPDAATWDNQLPKCIFLSTNSVTLQMFLAKGGGSSDLTLNATHFKPLLLNIPSIKESTDIESRKFKISNVSLDISNLEYEGKRFTDILSNTSLTNWKCSVQFVSPTGNGYSLIHSVVSDSHPNNISFYDKYKDDPDYAPLMTQMVYQGIIRRITHDDTKVKVQLEDLTEQKAHKDLPQAYLEGDDVVDRYKNKAIPICYGHVNRSPVLIKGTYLIPDYKEIDGYEPLISNYSPNGITSIASINIDKTYYNIPNKIIQNKWYNDTTSTLTDEFDVNDEPLVYEVGDIQLQEEDSPFLFTGAKLINIGLGVLAGYDMIQAGIIRKASGLEALKEQSVAFGQEYNLLDELQIGYEAFDEEEMHILSDDSYSASVQVYPQNYANPEYYVYDDYAEQNNLLTGGGGLRLKDGNISASAFSVFRKAMSINGIVVVKAYSGDLGLGLLGLTENPYDPSIASQYTAVEQGVNGNDYMGLFTYDVQEYLNGNRDFLLKYETGVLVDDAYMMQASLLSDPTSFLSGIGGASENLGKITILQDSISIGGVDITALYDTHAKFDYLFRFKEFESYIYGNIEKALSKDFYASVNGRINTFTDHPEPTFIGDKLDTTDVVEGDFIENPIDIIYDLVRSELGHDAIDEAEYKEAKDAHLGWKFGFTVNKKINSKKLIEEIAKSTKCFPKFKNDGTFGFNTIKDSYTVTDADGNGDYENAHLIKESEVISYSFKKTKPEQIYKKVTVSYNKDYAQDSHLKTALSEDLGADPYYGIENSADAHLEFESDYIRNKDTAEDLTTFLSEQYRNDHLVFNLKLPLQYIDLEIGDLVKFRDLFQGVKAYGIDYRLIQDIGEPSPNGGSKQRAFPLFMIISTKKNLDSVEIECMQLHHLHTFSSFVEEAWYDGTDEGETEGEFYFPDADTIVIPQADPEEEDSVERVYTNSAYIDYTPNDVAAGHQTINLTAGGGLSLNQDSLEGTGDFLYNFSDLPSELYEEGFFEENAQIKASLYADETIYTTFRVISVLNNYELVASIDGQPDWWTETADIVIERIDTTDVYQLGDVNLDLQVNILDIVGLVNYILGLTYLTESQQGIADFNQEGNINILDIVGLVNSILGTD